MPSPPTHVLHERATNRSPCQSNHGVTRVRVLNAENIVYVAAGARHVPEQGDPAPGASAGAAAPLQEQSRRPYFRRLCLDVAPGGSAIALFSFQLHAAQHPMRRGARISAFDVDSNWGAFEF